MAEVRVNLPDGRQVSYNLCHPRLPAVGRCYFEKIITFETTSTN
ncbi:MAG: hypothetical protein AB1298_10910 [Bacteroidota bacterium]